MRQQTKQAVSKTNGVASPSRFLQELDSRCSAAGAKRENILVKAVPNPFRRQRLESGQSPMIGEVAAVADHLDLRGADRETLFYTAGYHEGWYRDLTHKCLPSTVRDYVFLVRQFLDWLAGRQLTLDELVAYRWWLQKERTPTLSPKRIRLWAAAMRSYLKFRREAGERELPEGTGFPLPAAENLGGERECPTGDEVERLYEAILELPRHNLAQRLKVDLAWAILAVYTYNGLRRSEALNLRADNVVVVEPVDIEGKPDPTRETTVTIRIQNAKGGIDTTVPIVGKTRDFLLAYRKTRREYLDERPPVNGEAEIPWFWITNSQKRFHDNGLRILCRSLCKYAGIENYTPHQFRHFCGTMINQIADIKVAQKVLRHKRLETTVRYLHASDERVRDAMTALANGHSQPAAPARGTAPNAAAVSLVICRACHREYSSVRRECFHCGHPNEGATVTTVAKIPTFPAGGPRPRGANSYGQGLAV